MKFSISFLIFNITAMMMLNICSAETGVNFAVVQEMTGPFDNPEGSIVGLDGKMVFISNAAAISGKFSFIPGEGYITKMIISPDGKLTLVEQKFVKGLTRPWGMAVLPVTIGKYPAGTVFVGVGGPPIEGVKNASRLESGIVAFSPDTGQILGKINGGIGSVFQKISEGPLLNINALAFDKTGNLYFTDTAGAWNRFPESGPLPVRPGVWKIESSRLEELLSGNKHSDKTDGIKFCYIAGAPDGIEVSPIGKLYINTVGSAAVYWGPPLYDPFDGAVYRLSEHDFDKGYITTKPVITGLGALDGLAFTLSGTMICSEVMRKNDIIVFKISQDNVVTTFLNVPQLYSPADISIAEIAGNIFVIIPEHTSGVDDNKMIAPAMKEVTVIKLLNVK